MKRLLSAKFSGCLFFINPDLVFNRFDTCIRRCICFLLINIEFFQHFVVLVKFVLYFIKSFIYTVETLINLFKMIVDGLEFFVQLLI